MSNDQQRELKFDLESATELVLRGLDILATNGVATLAFDTSKTVMSARDKFFCSKVEVLLIEMGNCDNVLLGQTLQNLKDEHGEQYFSEKLFHIIEQSDSRMRTTLIARALKLCVSNELPRSEFWAVLFVIQNIDLSDLKLLELAVETQMAIDRSSDEGSANLRKKLEAKIGMRTLLRYQAVALARASGTYGGSSIPSVNVKFGLLVMKVIDEVL